VKSNHIDITPASASPCPIGAGWHRRWREYTLATVRHPRPPLDAGGAGIGGLPTRVMPLWEVGAGDPSVFSGESPLTTYAHQHAAFRVRGHDIHVDLIAATGSGPGFGLDAVLIFVDGVFRGRAWVFGCLGGSGNNFPAEARIDESSYVAVSYEPGQFGTSRLPHIWVTASSTPENSRGRG